MSRDPFDDDAAFDNAAVEEDERYVPILRSENAGQTAFVHGLFEASDVPYRSTTDMPLLDGVAFHQPRFIETFLVPESAVYEARDMLIAGIAEIPALRQQIEHEGEWGEDGGSPVETTVGLRALAAFALVAALATMFSYVLAHLR